jgi:hypothetical protein
MGHSFERVNFKSTVQAGDIEFPVTVIRFKEDMEFEQVIIADINKPGLEFAFTHMDRAGEYLADNYQLELSYATELITAIVKSTEPQREERPKDDYVSSQSDWRELESSSKRAKRGRMKKQIETFELAGKKVTKVTRLVDNDSEPINVENVKLDKIYWLEVKTYSKKSRISTLYKLEHNDETGSEERVVILGNSVLKDVIYKYAELLGMTFKQADMFIKSKRGLTNTHKKRGMYNKNPVEKDILTKLTEKKSQAVIID